MCIRLETSSVAPVEDALQEASRQPAATLLLPCDLSDPRVRALSIETLALAIGTFAVCTGKKSIGDSQGSAGQ